MRGSTLDIRIWRLQRRQILTSKVDPHTVRVKQLIISLNMSSGIFRSQETNLFMLLGTRNGIYQWKYKITHNTKYYVKIALQDIGRIIIIIMFAGMFQVCSS